MYCLGDWRPPATHFYSQFSPPGIYINPTSSPAAGNIAKYVKIKDKRLKKENIFWGMQPTLSGGQHGGQWGTKWSIKDSAAILCAHIIIPNAGQPLHLPLTERNICYGLFVAARSIYLCIAISLLLVRYLAETNEVKEPPRSKSRRRKLWKLHLCKNQDIWSSVNRDPEKSEIGKSEERIENPWISMIPFLVNAGWWGCMH